MRVLLHRFPRQAPLLRALQKNNPVFVRLHDLRLTYGSLDEALGFALFSAYTGSSDALKFDAFRKNNSLVSGCVVDIITVIVRRSGGCAMLVLDDINQLGNVRYAKWSGAVTLHAAAIRLDLAMIALYSHFGVPAPLSGVHGLRDWPLAVVGTEGPRRLWQHGQPALSLPSKSAAACSS